MLVIGAGQAGLAVGWHLREQGTRLRTAMFADGSAVEVAAVLCATGFRTDYSWLDIPGAQTRSADLLVRRPEPGSNPALSTQRPRPTAPGQRPQRP